MKIGDIVDIYWENVNAEFGAKILYIPSAMGDNWHLERNDGTIMYVNNFSKMTLTVPDEIKLRKNNLPPF